MQPQRRLVAACSPLPLTLVLMGQNGSTCSGASPAGGASSRWTVPTEGTRRRFNVRPRVRRVLPLPHFHPCKGRNCAIKVEM